MRANNRIVCNGVAKFIWRLGTAGNHGVGVEGLRCRGAVLGSVKPKGHGFKSGDGDRAIGNFGLARLGRRQQCSEKKRIE